MSNKELLITFIRNELEVVFRRYNRYLILDSDYARERTTYYRGFIDALWSIKHFMSELDYIQNDVDSLREAMSRMDEEV